MRLAVLGLLLANLVVFAWSQWLSPAAPTAAMTAAATPTGPGGGPSRILLASEAPPPPVTATEVPADGAALTDASALTGADAATTMVDGTAAPAEGTPTATGGLTAVARDGSGTAAGVASPVAGTPAISGAIRGGASGTAAVEARRCMSIGPISELELTAQATAMLKQDGYEPRQRPANGPVPDGFMVMIGPLKGEADQARVVGRLNRGGLDGAFALPKLEDGYSVSVGLFSQRARAERRALAVERMGLKASVVERTRPGTVYWIDFDLKTAPVGGGAALDPMLKTPDPSQKWQVVPCPQPRPVG
jgi:hypothetical protein